MHSPKSVHKKSQLGCSVDLVEDSAMWIFLPVTWWEWALIRITLPCFAQKSPQLVPEKKDIVRRMTL